MSIEELVVSHFLHSLTDGHDTLSREMLESDFLIEGVEVHTTVAGGIAMSRECVVCTARIVASTLAGIFPEEHTARIHHLL